jgi:hypothetical protein
MRLLRWQVWLNDKCEYDVAAHHSAVIGCSRSIAQRALSSSCSPFHHHELDFAYFLRQRMDHRMASVSLTDALEGHGPLLFFDVEFWRHMRARTEGVSSTLALTTSALLLRTFNA